MPISGTQAKIILQNFLTQQLQKQFITQVLLAATINEEEKKLEEALAVDFSKLTKGEISQWFQHFNLKCI